MKNILLTFFLFSFVLNFHFLHAQNSLLVFAGQGAFSFVGTELNDDLPQYGRLIKPLQYKIPPVPAELKASTPELKLDYKRGLNRLLNSFQLEHLTYKKILPAYSIFGLGNYRVQNILPYDENSVIYQDSASLVAIRASVFKKNGLLEIIYAWAMPLYQNAFAAMSTPEQEDYLTLLESTKNYAENFNLQKEKKDLDSLQYDFAGTKGKLNAFVFRRIANKELTKEECITWLKKIINDLKSVKRKTPTEADKYVLYSRMDGDFFLAADYKSVSAYRRKTRIIHVANQKSEILDSIQFADIKYASADLIIGPQEKKDGKSIYRLFYCDSTGYKSFLLDGEEMGINDLVLGTGINKRLLLMNGADPSQTHVLVTIYDLDSGFVVLSSVWMQALPTQDPYSDQVLYNIKLTGDKLVFEDQNKLKGMLNLEGRIILAAQYKTIEAGKNEGEFILNGKKHIILN